MIFSMTGYGRATRTFGDKSVTIEVRALNSKLTDIRFKMPSNYKEREIDLRRIVTEQAERGKIDVSINVTSLVGDDDAVINKDLFRRYYKEIKQLTTELGVPDSDILMAILRLPNIVGGNDDGVPDEEWQMTLGTLEDALAEFKKFRHTEGGALAKELQLRSDNIVRLLAEIEPFEKERVVKLRQRLKQNLDDFMSKDNIDENRFEQEVLFYLEKMDVTEEKVRLTQHCKYFNEMLAEKNNSSKGRSLNFISQEMGREINTLGSKAYSSDIQRVVVQMKDELEKIKEQVANLV